MTRTETQGWVVDELSLREFYSPPPTFYPALRDEIGHRGRNEHKWMGMSLTEARALPQRGWPAGVQAARRLLDAATVDAPRSAKLARKWSADDGETLDVARLLDGLPPYRMAYRAPGGSSGRIVRLVVNAAANAKTTAESLAWTAYAAIRAIDSLEEAGYRVEVVMCYPVERVWYGVGYRLLVTVKRAEDPLDISQIAAALSPAAFRVFMFEWQDSVPRVGLTPGRGYADNHSEDGALSLPSVRSRYEAQEWLRKVEIK